MYKNNRWGIVRCSQVLSLFANSDIEWLYEGKRDIAK